MPRRTRSTDLGGWDWAQQQAAQNVEPIYAQRQSERRGQPGPSVPAGPSKPFDLWHEIAQYRNSLAEAIAGSPSNRAGELHEAYMDKFAYDLAPYLGETMTRGLLTGVGNFNETAAGVLGGLVGGKGFVGPQGIDYEDMNANDRGIDRGIARWGREDKRPRPSIFAYLGD